MDFERTDDRRMLADSLDRWLADSYPMEHRNSVAYRAPFHDPEKWAGLAELGILHALVPEDRGGFGGAGFDLVTVFESLGRALCPEPVLPALLAARILMATDGDLSPLLEGTTRYAFAWGEPEAPYDIDAIETEAVKSGGGWTLSGRKSVVYGAQVADRILILARTGDTLSVFEVEAGSVEHTDYGLIDGGGAADLFLDATPATLVLEDAGDAVRDALDHGRLALCAEAVGAMDAAKDMMLDYMRQRKQFGKAIGTFQALQHRAVEMVTEIEQARSMTILAASRMGTEEQSRTVSMAKNLIGRTTQLVAEESVQMQGGIAMTWEYPASHYAKRLTMIDTQLGDADWHLQRVMAGLQAA
ncbi:MAG: acyl-CoA dehydrogenase [Jannaschia sp.]